MSANKIKWMPILGLLLAMVLWGSSFIALKLAFQTYDPMVVIFGRMAVASICFLFLIKRFKGIRFHRQDLKYLFLLVLFEPCLYFIFESMALVNTTASQAGMIAALMPLIVALAAPFFINERLTGRTLAGFGLAIIGAIWLSAGAESSAYAPNPALGNFYEGLAMIFGAGYTILSKKLSPRYTPLFLTAFQAFGGSLFYLPLIFLPPTTLPTRFALEPILAIVYLGVFVTMGAYGLYNYGISRIPAGQASAFVNLIPVFTLVLGRLILGEAYNSHQYLASILVIAGVFISQQRAAPKTPIRGN